MGGLVRIFRDLSLAEDSSQDALLAALERWPSEGIPPNPGAWLMQTAKNRAIDRLRQRQMAERKHEEMAPTPELAPPSFETAMDDVAQDDLLRLMLISCHPVLSREARVALTLRLLGGLTTEEIARAFLVSEPTIAQRIVRAKRTLGEARVPFDLPADADLSQRIHSVLEVIYLIFNEGYAATQGDDWMRPSLCEDALRLGRILTALTPQQAEVHGLVALMELQASRTRARTGANGEAIALGEQDRSRWDQLLIHRGLTALACAESLARPLGPYTLQAAIAACHARAATVEQTDWAAIVALYDALVEITQSPIVELNRAVAVAMAFDPAAGLEIVNRLDDEAALADYHLLHCVRADLLERLGRKQEARREFERSAALAKNTRERDVLLARARKLAN